MILLIEIPDAAGRVELGEELDQRAKLFCVDPHGIEIPALATLEPAPDASAQEIFVNPIQRLLEYAAAFEWPFVDDDWTRLEPFFTEGVDYEVTGGPLLGGRWEGRDAVLAQLKASVDGLDRRFDERKTELLGAPTADGNTASFGWRGT